jgi:hypothetical protein
MTEILALQELAPAEPSTAVSICGWSLHRQEDTAA